MEATHRILIPRPRCRRGKSAQSSAIRPTSAQSATSTATAKEATKRMRQVLIRRPRCRRSSSRPVATRPTGPCIFVEQRDACEGRR
eukprot:3848043-Alexandrium_andersonii.AAC.1